MGISPNRLVAVLTPLVFAPLAGAISVFAADHIPGMNIDSGQLQSVFIAGALIAFGKAGLWLKGWQDWEKTQNAVPAEVANDIALAGAMEPAASMPQVDDDPTLTDEDPDIDPDDDDASEDDDEWQSEIDGYAVIGTD
ncbi:MAG TPA: hypothetical protein VFX51_24310 [Solirubrobacteraceae bacterium]|nr:hypothetical protein [Solirubrobacteraceae bacterium]